MGTNSQATAILLFSRSAEAESIAKPLAGLGKVQNLAISKHLIRHALAVTRQSRLPWFCIEEGQQFGANFGERFANAFEQVFALGFGKVIAVGNDCPGLTASDLLLAVQKLDNENAVFGPAKDGGAYLIGFRRAAFEKTGFAALPWQTHYTLSGLKSYAQGCFSLLTEKADIDSTRDLRRLLAYRRMPVQLWMGLLNAILTPPPFCVASRWTPKDWGLAGALLRGPPVVT